jgi:hypothetical protein
VYVYAHGAMPPTVRARVRVCMHGGVYAYACVGVHVRIRVLRGCVGAWVRACVRACVSE